MKSSTPSGLSQCPTVLRRRLRSRGMQSPMYLGSLVGTGYAALWPHTRLLACLVWLQPVQVSVPAALSSDRWLTPLTLSPQGKFLESHTPMLLQLAQQADRPLLLVWPVQCSVLELCLASTNLLEDLELLWEALLSGGQFQPPWDMLQCGIVYPGANEPLDDFLLIPDVVLQYPPLRPSGILPRRLQENNNWKYY